MDENYKVKVNNAFDFELTKEDIENLNIVKNSPQEYHLISDHKSHDAQVISSDFIHRKYQVKVNNKVHNIHINNALDNIIEDLGFSLESTKLVNNIKAPMPGLILEISVKVGDHVNENDTLLILEAMKMENLMASPREGIIKEIYVSKGGTVDKNELLIEFE